LSAINYTKTIELLKVNKYTVSYYLEILVTLVERFTIIRENAKNTLIEIMQK